MDDAAVSDEKDCTVNDSTFAEDDVVANDDTGELFATGRVGDSSLVLVVVVVADVVVARMASLLTTASDDNESHWMAAGSARIIVKKANTQNVRFVVVGLLEL